MKIYAFSDSHNLHKKLTVPECDLLIHAGDATNRGTFPEISDFIFWFGTQPAKHKLFIPGNHDWMAQREPDLFRQLCKENGIIPLINEYVEIEGLKIWGSPITPFFCNWAFNAFYEELKETWAKIPAGLDVLITHGPPYGILDHNSLGKSCGCNYLFDELLTKAPKTHIFGHIHDNNGLKEMFGIKFYNVSICNDSYRVENQVTEIDL